MGGSGSGPAPRLSNAERAANRAKQNAAYYAKNRAHLIKTTKENRDRRIAKKQAKLRRKQERAKRVDLHKVYLSRRKRVKLPEYSQAEWEAMLPDVSD